MTVDKKEYARDKNLYDAIEIFAKICKALNFLLFHIYVVSDAKVQATDFSPHTLSNLLRSLGVVGRMRFKLPIMSMFLVLRFSRKHLPSRVVSKTNVVAVNSQNQLI